MIYTINKQGANIMTQLRDFYNDTFAYATAEDIDALLCVRPSRLNSKAPAIVTDRQAIKQQPVSTRVSSK